MRAEPGVRHSTSAMRAGKLHADAPTVVVGTAHVFGGTARRDPDLPKDELVLARGVADPRQRPRRHGYAGRIRPTHDGHHEITAWREQSERRRYRGCGSTLGSAGKDPLDVDAHRHRSGRG